MTTIHATLHTICDLATREVRPTREVPQQVQPAEWMKILDTHLFITTALAHLESDSPLLRGLAEKRLSAFIRML